MEESKDFVNKDKIERILIEVISVENKLLDLSKKVDVIGNIVCEILLLLQQNRNKSDTSFLKYASVGGNKIKKKIKKGIKKIKRGLNIQVRQNE